VSKPQIHDIQDGFGNADGTSIVITAAAQRQHPGAALRVVPVTIHDAPQVKGGDRINDARRSLNLHRAAGGE